MAYLYHDPSEEYVPTLNAYDNFNSDDDAEALRKAMKGIGTDEDAIIDILCHRNSEQRQKIMTSYKSSFGRDLIVDLNSELSGNVETIIEGLMLTWYEYDAKTLYEATKGAGTNESALIEILCSRTNAEIRFIRQTYKEKYGKTLEEDIESDTSSTLKRLLVSLCTAERNERSDIDLQKALEDATLKEAGEMHWGTDESIFNKILCTQSFFQLQAVFQAYESLSENSEKKITIEQVIEKEFSGAVKKAYLAIVKIAKSRPAFFASQLYEAMKGAGTNEDQLIRVIVSRCEVDMQQIKDCFFKLYEKSLEEFINIDTSGDFKKILLALIQ